VGVANLQTTVQSTTNNSTFTFTAADLGAEHPDRYIIGAITASDTAAGNFGITSATIGGVAANVAIQREDTTDGRNSYIIIAKVPTGATGTIVVTFTGDHEHCRVAVYRVIGLVSITPHATASDIADPIATTINVPHNGLLICCATMATGGTASTPTGITELYDLAVESARHTGGMDQNLAVATGRSVGFNGAGACSGVFATWQLSMSLAFNPSPLQPFLAR